MPETTVRPAAAPAAEASGAAAAGAPAVTEETVDLAGVRVGLALGGRGLVACLDLLLSKMFSV